MTISSKHLLKISKFLSYHLRHCPDLLGLNLAPGGWVEVNKLLVAEKNNFIHKLLANKNTHHIKI